jgi:glycosyltransferase involved in cell wall biosynthesis
MIRVMHFADLINKNDFIDVILRQANRAEFKLFACVRNVHSNIAPPDYPPDVERFVLPGMHRINIPATAWRLARLLHRCNIDILHTHHYDQAVIGWLATRLHPATKFLIGRHYSNAIYLLARGFGKFSLLKIEGRVNAAADGIVVPSRMISELLAKQGVDSRKIRVVHYAFPREKWEAAEQADREALRASLGLTGLVFANFSRMHLEKGHTFLLKAIAKVRSQIPDVKVIFVGDGPVRSALEGELAQLDLRNHVQMLGWRRDALMIMAAVDVVLHPSLQEAFPQTMVEALYLRKPLVITPVSGAVDIIENGVNGIMIPMRDPDAIADAMQRLAADPSLRQRLGETGRRYVEENLTVEKIIPQFERIYCTLMER